MLVFGLHGLERGLSALIYCLFFLLLFFMAARTFRQESDDGAAHFEMMLKASAATLQSSRPVGICGSRDGARTRARTTRRVSR